MATFEEQIEGLTGITISSANTVPTQDQLSVFLRDAVRDVTRQTLTINPTEVNKFVKESDIIINNNEYKHNAEIVQVLRNANDINSNDWRDCSLIPQSHTSRAQDKSSLFYASKFNPAYSVSDDMTISVFPAPSSDEAFKLLYLNDEPVNENGESLTFSDSTIKYFPKEKVHLVILYAAIKSMEAQMSDFIVVEEDFELATSMERAIGLFKQRYMEASMLGMSSPSQQEGDNVSNEEVMRAIKSQKEQ